MIIVVKSKRVILDLCSGTGSWSQPYMDAGYHVVRYDLESFSMSDIRLLEYRKDNVYGILAAPPCTDLSSSGARWWAEKGIDRLVGALGIVDACLRQVVLHQPKFWCLENPVGRLVHYLGRPCMTFDPCDYGDPWVKKTCLWGNFVIPPKKRVYPSMGSLILRMRPSIDRAMHRSQTPSGFAFAFFNSNR